MVIRKYFYKQVSKHLALPGSGPMGWYVLRRMDIVNRHLVVNCVRLLEIKRDDKILEVGFGTGNGLEAAYGCVKDGSGIIYGIDPSIRVFRNARKRFSDEIRDNKIQLFPVRLPFVEFKKNFFDGIYHTNCYYFWWNMPAACAELHNILKPHGKMVTTLNIDRLKALKAKGGFHVGDYDPLRYMASLETVGFENIRIEYLTDSSDNKFQEYQAIYAEAGDKKVSKETELNENITYKISNNETNQDTANTVGQNLDGTRADGELSTQERAQSKIGK